MREIPRKRLFVILAAAALVLPAAAFGKGPTSATLEGPGTAAITFSSYQGPEPNLTHITEHAGFMAAAFGGAPDRMLPARPAEDLGPRYTLTYEIGPEHVVVQDVYPYAKPDAVTYTRPGQQIFVGERSRGGWFRAGPQLKQTLVAAGLPESAATGSSDGSSFPTTTVSLVVFALLFVAATALLVRRRTHPAAA